MGFFKSDWIRNNQVKMSMGLTRESYKGPLGGRKTTFVFLFWIILIQTSRERLVGILDSGGKVVPLEWCHFWLVLRSTENNMTKNVTTNINKKSQRDKFHCTYWSLVEFLETTYLKF